MTDSRFAFSAPPRLRQSVVLAVVSVGLALAASFAVLPARPEGAAAGLLLYGVVSLSVIDRIDAHLPLERFGLANWITLIRAAGITWLVAALVSPELLAAGSAWAAAGLAGILLALDGVDGWVARRQRLCSRFGARFDMEVDALLILVLSAMALVLGKAGPWVLALGLMRYLFVGAALVLPMLGRDLFPSLRRKVVCVLQIAILTLLLAPPVAPPVSQLLAAVALAALTWSFAADIRWLLRRRG